MRRYIVAIFVSLALLVGFPMAAQAADHPNGIVCYELKGNTTSSGFEVGMDSGRGLLPTVYPKPGYCTDWYKPGYYVSWIHVYANKKCYSQYGNLLAGGKNGHTFYWSSNATSSTVSKLSCIQVSIGGSWSPTK